MTISYFLDIARSGRCLPMATDLVLERGSGSRRPRGGMGLGWARSWNDRARVGLHPWPSRSWTCGSTRPTCWPGWGLARTRPIGFISLREVDRATREALHRDGHPAAPAAWPAMGPCGTSPARPSLCRWAWSIGPFSLATKLMADPDHRRGTAGLGRFSPRPIRR